MRRLGLFRYVAPTAALALAMGGCSSTVEEEPAREYLGTQAPGDVWNWTFDAVTQKATIHWDAGTFDDLSDDIEIVGDYTELPSGFLKIENIDATPDNAEIPEDGTAWFYAMEVPGVALFIKPEGAIKGDLIAAVAVDSCDGLLGDYLWVQTAVGGGIPGWDPLTHEAYGTASFTGTLDAVNLSVSSKSLDCIDGGACTHNETDEIPMMVGACEAGGLTIMEGDATMSVLQATVGGAVVVDSGAGNGGIFGFKQSDVTLADFNDRSYHGVIFNDGESTPLRMDFNGTNFGIGVPFTDVETGEFAQGEAGQLELLSVENGLIEAELTVNAGTSPVAAIGWSDGPRAMFVFIARNADPDTDPAPESWEPQIIGVMVSQ